MIVNNMNNVTKATLEEPSLWLRQEFAIIINFVDAVSNNRKKS